MAARRHSMSPATPARSALAAEAATAPASRSEPSIGPGAPAGRARAPAAASRSHAAASNPGQRMNAKRRADARRDPPRQQRRLDRDRPRAAHRVEQRRRSVPARAHEHRRRQRLPQRRLGRGEPVAAAMQQLTRGIGAHGALVAKEPDDELLGGVALRRAGSSRARGREQPLRDRVLVVEPRLPRRYPERDRAARCATNSRHGSRAA